MVWLCSISTVRWRRHCANSAEGIAKERSQREYVGQSSERKRKLQKRYWLGHRQNRESYRYWEIRGWSRVGEWNDHCRSWVDPTSVMIALPGLESHVPCHDDLADVTHMRHAQTLTSWETIGYRTPSTESPLQCVQARPEQRRSPCCCPADT